VGRDPLLSLSLGIEFAKIARGEWNPEADSLKTYIGTSTTKWWDSFCSGIRADYECDGQHK
jgi:hypothetical protein